MSEVSASILVVDDDQINRMVLAHDLEQEGHRVTAVEDGGSALEALRDGRFDVVLLDVLMPELDGYETLAQIERNEKLRHVPVIMVSALEDIESVVRCIELGAADYLPKPFDPVLLRARINGCLTKKRLHDLELEYIEQVGHVVDAATAVENGSFTAESLDAVAARDDALGRLARVFRRMAREVTAREQALKQEVAQLRIEIDAGRAATQLAEITETDYFQDLLRKAHELRERPE
ncbi:MAG: response regulator [Thermoleophilia bacterium]|nr:response regulator [Thermoleophilia bacterium]